MPGETMKAVYAARYGPPDVLEVRELAVPLPGRNEILVKVAAAGVSRANSMMREGRPYFGRLMLGLTKPKYPVPGSTFSGEVVALGPGANGFAVGDRVAGETGERGGCLAGFVCTRTTGAVAKLPPHIDPHWGAVICDGAITGYNFIAVVCGVKRGNEVLVNGASGAVGSAAVQIAKAQGATVTGVCSEANKEYVRSLGADKVIDYRQSDFTKGRYQYDAIFDTVGNVSLRQVRRVLASNAVFASSVLSGQILASMLGSSMFGKQKAKFSATGLADAKLQRGWMEAIFKLIEEGDLRIDIEKVYALDNIREACAFVDSGRKRGSIVVDLLR